MSVTKDNMILDVATGTYQKLIELVLLIRGQHDLAKRHDGPILRTSVGDC